MPDRARACRVLLVLVALLAMTGSSFAHPPRAGVVTAVYGTATVSRASLKAPLSLKFRDDVFALDRITTGEESYARILLGGAAVVNVRERSVVTITDTPRLSTIHVGGGGIALSVARERMKPGQAIEIRTPNAAAGIRGTVIITEVASGATRFTLLTGKVDVRAAGATVTLLPRQAVSIVGAAPPGVVQRVSTDEASGIAGRFQIPLVHAPKTPEAWIATEQVQRAMMAREHGPIDFRRDGRIDVRPDRGRAREHRVDADDDESLASPKHGWGRGPEFSLPSRLGSVSAAPLPVPVPAAGDSSGSGKRGKKAGD